MAALGSAFIAASIPETGMQPSRGRCHAPGVEFVGFQDLERVGRSMIDPWLQVMLQVLASLLEIVFWR